MLRRWSLNWKMRTAFGFLGICLMGTGAVGISSANRLSESYGHITDVNFPKSLLASDLKITSEKAMSLILQMNQPGNVEKEIKRLQGRVDETLAQHAVVNQSYMDLAMNAEERALYDAMMQKWTPLLARLRTSAQLAASLAPEDKLRMAQEYATADYLKMRKDYYAAIEGLMAFQQNEAKKWIESAHATANEARILVTTAVVAGAFFALMTGFLFSRAISKTLQRIAEALQSGANTISQASRSTAESTQELSSSVTEQAAATQETSAAIEQLMTMVQKNAESCSHTSRIANASKDAVDEGRRALQGVVNSVSEVSRNNEDIAKAVEMSNARVEEILGVIGDIAEKTKVINDIVFQTKLLSFNASVEAARAGEGGKGFAVVAEEVGNLAAMSGRSATEISGIVQESLKTVQEIVRETKERMTEFTGQAKAKIEASHAAVQSCETAFTEVITQVSQVNVHVAEISRASQEQSKGIQEITKAVTQIDHATTQNASVSQEVANASSEIQRQSSGLEDMSAELFSTVNGGMSKAA